ncbi:LysM peptidoglycan-binding domain-containing protein [Falsibacillus albus]|uniref:LysM peptidoglycan-binding domain-containing protein n=1 Tax=Falsibacillus albus TaxID=2478915 RepID=A0A3L7JWF5_9BACI|nr:LysM peptidoglycan-binding domain-containing protein [Falsibacillus albus]RLQ95063.1 LysM peptidoglycan-binding domain-containing protein [Falsibacillus albus]
MRTDEYRDQAERLRKRIDKIEPSQSELSENKTRGTLPPRNEHHRQKKKKTKWNPKFPLIKLLMLSFILLPISIFGLYTYFEKHPISTPVLNNGVGEEVSFSSSSEDSSSEHVSAKENNDIDASPDEAQDNKNNGENKNVQQKDKPQDSSAVDVKDKPDSIADEKNENQKKEDELNVVEHTVQSNETIYRIAMNYFHSKDGIEKIKEYNHLPSNDIEVGQVLKIPLPK